jgi:hypothetical protein
MTSLALALLLAATPALDERPERPVYGPSLDAERAAPGSAPWLGESEGRVRWGVDHRLGLMGFPYFGAPGSVAICFFSGTEQPPTGGGVGLEARVGYQASRLFGAYVNAVALVGWPLHAFVGGSLLAELTFLDHLSLAIGPGGGYAAWPRDLGDARAAITLDVRLGYTFGSRDDSTGRRRGFTLGLDFLLFFDGTRPPSGPTSSGGVSAMSLALTAGFDAR